MSTMTIGMLRVSISVAPRVAPVARPIRRALRDWDGFAGAMEAALTGLVGVGALLFFAGLLRYGAPAWSWAGGIADVVDAGAALAGLVCVAATLRGFARLVWPNAGASHGR